MTVYPSLIADDTEDHTLDAIVRLAPSSKENIQYPLIPEISLPFALLPEPHKHFDG